ncbi:MAG: NUDIX domain-containing protein [Chitinophagaceae bacterium]|nr:NUDIX domain-containing protein [Chitinophagaceae bacterium]MCW5904665.1 NUDIX domain-containing protein [Chitinophagaceae bacterium]
MKKNIIIAAGGLVVNDKNELLLIFRRNKWDLPKGKLDEGESIETCAVREVKEETGLQNIELKNFIGKTYHEYFDTWTKKNVIKETWWYAMSVQGNPSFIPQTEEDIEKIIWADKTTLQQCLKNTYTTIIDIISIWQKQ